VPLGDDPFSFLIERGQTFYATDFKRMLHQLPWYRGSVQVGTVVAVPVRVGDVIVGRARRDKLETQAFTGREPRILAGIAELASEAIRGTRASLGARSSTPSSRPSTRSRSGSRRWRASPRCASCCCARPATWRTSRPGPW
jgi:hypothetical protein